MNHSSIGSESKRPGAGSVDLSGLAKIPNNKNSPCKINKSPRKNMVKDENSPVKCESIESHKIQLCSPKKGVLTQITAQAPSDRVNNLYAWNSRRWERGAAAKRRLDFGESLPPQSSPSFRPEPHCKRFLTDDASCTGLEKSVVALFNLEAICGKNYDKKQARIISHNLVIQFFKTGNPNIYLSHRTIGKKLGLLQEEMYT